MTQRFQLGNNELVPLKEAVLLVPYSRDYISRLAREGKIVAFQFNRQWVVDSASLLNFYDQAKIEEGVRRHHLKELRLQEREVREMFALSLETLDLQHSSARYHTHKKTVAVVLCGLIVGLFSYTLSLQVTPQRAALIAQIPQNLFGANSSHTKVVVAADISPVVSGLYVANEVTESFTLSHGLVLASASTTDSLEDIQVLFSDEVVVEMTSTTTGQITLPGLEGNKIPFVRVPLTPAIEPTDATP